MDTLAAIRDRELVDALRSEAVRARGIPMRVAEEAADATSRWLRSHAGRAAGPARVTGYFWGVVRRRALAGKAGLGRYRARCLAETLAVDLLSAGHARDRVLEELTRAVGPSEAADVLSAIAA